MNYFWFLYLFFVCQDFKGLALQEFRTQPQNVSAILGQTVIMKCEVVNQAGNIQWSKDGFALGFDRSIPGYPNFEVVGNENLGEFNLMISDVRLEDDAEFQCQVMPTSDNPKLSASAFLTVRVPPDTPEIEGYLNGSVVEVPYTQQYLQLSCLARNGRPAATINWYKDSEKLTSGIEDSTIIIPGDKRLIAKSKLTLQPKYGYKDNDAYITCQATNNAVQGPPLETTVQLSILIPPGAPEVTGYTEGQTVRTGDTLQLVCTSRGGNPLAHVVWFKNDHEVDFSYVTSQNKAENEMAINPVQDTDNDAIYRCEVSNVVTPSPLTASFKLTVLFPPKKVKISGHKLALAGEKITLACVSTNSNPAAVITWLDSNGRQLPETKTNVKASSNGGFISRSTVKVNLTGQDNNVMYTCQATNEELRKTVSSTVTLSVLYPPAPPTISDYTAGIAINAGELQRISCTAVGGNPLATIKWYLGSKMLDSDYKIIGNIACAELSIIVKPKDNKEVYVCKASNNATSKPLKATITLTVNFPPTSVTITAHPKKAVAGQKLTLTCVSASSNPPAEITWFKEGHRLQGINEGTQNGSFGGQKTLNKLELVLTPEDHQAIYGCRATNLAMDQSVNDAITLNVQFKPQFDVEMSPSQIVIVEGQSRFVNFTAIGNPLKIRYSLWKDGQKLNVPVVLPHFKVKDGLLNITSIQQEDMGEYQVKAINSMGTSVFNVSIDVQYAANITRITTPVLMDEGGMAYFECVADANPMTDNMVRWIRDNYDMTKTRQTYEKGSAYLTVYELSRLDTGQFTCSAYNGIGNVITRVAQLIVKYPPQIDTSPQFAKSASEKGETGRLVCKAEGAPEVTFSWSKDGVEITNSSKYTSTTNKLDSVHYENILSVKNVTMVDYGTYACKASNEKGTVAFGILLDGTSRPDPPYDVKFVNATHESITLTWKPGFDGGLEQQFRVKYRPTGDPNFMYVDVGSVTSVYTVAGLKLGTEYEMTILGFNKLGESEYQVKGIIARTSNVVPSEDGDPSALQGSDDVPVIIILVVCIVGIFLLALNIGLILFFIRRKRKRLENGSDTTSHTNTFELFGSSKETHLYPKSPSEDARSYDTCDKSLDEFSDECSKSYEDDDVKRVFLPPHDYSGRPYTQCKQESPRMDSKRTFLVETPNQLTYLDNNGRRSPWKQEDIYRAPTPRKKTSDCFENNQSILGEKTGSGIVFDGNTNWAAYRPRSAADFLDKPGSRPSSRAGKTPPPPPIRTSSRGATDAFSQNLPPLPARLYSSQDLPRYAPAPGSSNLPLSPNIVPNPSYESPPRVRSTTPSSYAAANKLEMRGHLV